LDHQAQRVRHDQERGVFRALSILLHALGAIPIDRKAYHGVLEQMVHLFNTRDEFLLAVVPEGTRKKIRTIRTGFRPTAKAAHGSIICTYMDNENKATRWLGEIVPGET
jgi:1-acyl-sn-glycerol-3-phosphate acyltransferase